MAAHGIAPGSVWQRGKHRFVVESAAGDFIHYRQVRGKRLGRELIEHHEIYRWKHKRWRELRDPADRELLSRFSMSLVNLEHMHVFVRLEDRQLFARRANRTPEDARIAARGSPSVPDTALFVGTYTHPFPADAFLGDFEAVLAKIRIGAGANRAR